jgi:O-methyltransferase
MHSLIRPDALNELAEAARAAPDGDLVEVGVYKGGSAWVLDMVGREQGRKVWLFDTFKGTPHANSKFDLHKKHDFCDVDIEEVRAVVPDSQLVVGVFPNTLKDADALGMGKVALAHIDCDQYRSVKACCEHLAKRMVPGGVMVFDDYDVLPGAKQAVDEVFGSRVAISAQGKARVYF